MDKAVWYLRFFLLLIVVASNVLTLRPMFAQSQSDVTPTGKEDDLSSAEDLDSLYSMFPIQTGPQLFFDAQTTEFTRDGKQQVFKGDVVTVGGGVLITADRVTVDQNSRTLRAEGNVIILTENQVFTGDTVNYQMDTGDFLIVNAVMVINDKKKAEEVSKKVLGFTPAEIAFEQMKSKRLQFIEERKNQLRSRFVSEYRAGVKEPSADVVDQYSLLLEQEELTRKQENPFFAKLTQDRRRRFKARRLYWEKGASDARKLQAKRKVTAFFRIDGKQLSRKNENDFTAKDAFWTPCRCEEDESPAWGFRTSKVDAQIEGYIDFYHPVLEIKGVPVLYLPYLKVPVKEQRQSGFLMPTFANRSASGNIYSQPVYFALAKDLDTTLTTEIYEKRGTKLGMEVRYQQKQYSGWNLNLEGIRDRVWMEDRRVRQQANDYYFDNDDEHIKELCTDDDPNAEAQCIRVARSRIEIPRNEWRGAQVWQGLSILAPRLSFVSRGNLYSDHRYVEDLTLYRDFESALDSSSQATMFSTSRYRLNLDGKNFFAGIGGSFGDHVLSSERFEGQQMPIKLSLQSRYINLDRDMFFIPIYGQLSGQHYQIQDFQGNRANDAQVESENQTLGSGFWQRVRFDEVAPLVSTGVIKVDQFFSWEARKIAHDHLDEKESAIQSWRTGVTVNLPLDGEGFLPTWKKAKDETPSYLRHYMNWALTFSVRPEVTRRGPYGEFRSQYYEKGEYKDGPELVYFESDRNRYLENKSDINRNDMMIPHKKIELATAHTWDTFSKGWERLPGSFPQTSEEGVADKKEESYEDRARRELMSTLDRPVGGIEKMFDETRKQWLINRYQLAEKDHRRVASLNADISYDFLEAERREEEKARRREGEIPDTGELYLPKAWSEPHGNLQLNLFNSTLRNELYYSIYYRRLTEQSFTLSLPRILNTGLIFGYSIGNEPRLIQESGSLDFTRTEEKTMGVSSGIIPNFLLSTTLGRRTKEYGSEEPGEDANEYKTVYGVDYLSPSDCWRLRFERQKKYGTDERDSVYILELSVIFLGRDRSTSNISAGLVRELPGNKDGE